MIDVLAVLERKCIRLVESFGTYVAIKLLLLCLRLCHVYLAVIVLIALKIFHDKLSFLLIIKS